MQHPSQLLEGDGGDSSDWHLLEAFPKWQLLGLGDFSRLARWTKKKRFQNP